MEWILVNPQIHSTFGSLGYHQSDGYHINENCNSYLQNILENILSEDKCLRTYRRNISFGQNIKKDLIPLLIHAKENKTIELTIKILVNLTIPVECLLSVELVSRSDLGRHTIFELNNLLKASKEGFKDARSTKVVINYMRKIIEREHKKLLCDDCENINNCLLLLRNLLHIPEESPYFGNSQTVYLQRALQNKILWNLFSQSVDKVLIKLMGNSEASCWAVTMVQLIALLYKDQHVVILQKLLNFWLEASLSESSEDNESNTSPPDQGSDDSSPMLTSDPTSDSSDNGGSVNSINDQNNQKKDTENESIFAVPQKYNSNISSPSTSHSEMGSSTTNSLEIPVETKLADVAGLLSIATNVKIRGKRRLSTSLSILAFTAENRNPNHQGSSAKRPCRKANSEQSDCGYGTQIENQESISTSSNEDESIMVKPVHQKPHNPKQRPKTQSRNHAVQDKKRKRIVKRGKTNIINVNGLSHHSPSDEDISNVMKEFTVDFLLKGYGSLVKTLHQQLLTNFSLQIDTSHFFWLLTYFLKFATQLEMDLEHVAPVLCYDILSYLTSEGVNLCEQLELILKLGGPDLKPCMRRMHLVVTAIREYIQAVETYGKLSHLSAEDRKFLSKLQFQISETDELRCLMVLLIRHYHPEFQSRQYLQDLVVTNHILLLFLDNVMKSPDYSGNTNIFDHIRRFATVGIMKQYGLLLQEFASNGEFVNDCIFTMMHHVAGDLDCISALHQNSILKSFSIIWKSEYELCDDWSDLVEYVINSFINKSHEAKAEVTAALADAIAKYEKNSGISPPVEIPKQTETYTKLDIEMETQLQNEETTISESSKMDESEEAWTEEELSALGWNHMQGTTEADIIGSIVRAYREEGIDKSRISVIKELLKQNIIEQNEYEQFIKAENNNNVKVEEKSESNHSVKNPDIFELCEQLKSENKGEILQWLQQALLEACYIKIALAKKALSDNQIALINNEDNDNMESYQPLMLPVAYHNIILNQSIILVPWTCEQEEACGDLKVLHLFHRLGFHLPVDSGKIFLRIPHFWSADFLYEVASRVAPIVQSTLKFSIKDLSEEKIIKSTSIPMDTASVSMPSTVTNPYRVHRLKETQSMVQYTPLPGPSTCKYNDEIGANAALSDDMKWLTIVHNSKTPKIDNQTNETCFISDEKNHIPLTSTVVPPIMMTAPLTDVQMPPLQQIMEPHPIEPLPISDDYSDTASVTSDLTRMYVSDEDE